MTFKVTQGHCCWCHSISYIIIVNCGVRKVLFLALSVCVFYLCMKCLGNRWTDLRQIHTVDVFGLSLGKVWRLRTKMHFLPLRRPTCSFMFAETSLASSYGRPMEYFARWFLLLSTCLSVCLSVCLSIYLSIYLSLSTFIPRLISAVADWMSTILLHMVWP